MEVVLADDTGNILGGVEHIGHATMQAMNPAEVSELTICQIKGET